MSSPCPLQLIRGTDIAIRLAHEREHTPSEMDEIVGDEQNRHIVHGRRRDSRLLNKPDSSTLPVYEAERACFLEGPGEGGSPGMSASGQARKCERIGVESALPATPEIRVQSSLVRAGPIEVMWTAREGSLTTTAVARSGNPGNSFLTMNLLLW
jgi:hypothetical protein